MGPMVISGSTSFRNLLSVKLTYGGKSILNRAINEPPAAQNVPAPEFNRFLCSTDDGTRFYMQLLPRVGPHRGQDNH